MIKFSFFPRLDLLSGNPYWLILKDSLVESGLDFYDNDTLRVKRLFERRGRGDILHFHYIQQFYAYGEKKARLDWVLRLGRNIILARLLGYRTIFTLHNLYPTYPLSPKWVDFLGYWLVIRLCHIVVVHSPQTKTLLSNEYGRKSNVLVVNHPNYIGFYPNTISKVDARFKLNIDRDKKVFLFFGGIRPNKGIEQLILAFHQIKDENILLVIAGRPWPPVTYYQNLVDLAANDLRIRWFPTYVPTDEVQLYFNSSDVVVLPFREILTSGSTLLAMSFGRPVVVPRMGGLVEVVGDGSGFTYNPELSDGLFTTLLKCLNSNLEEMGKVAFDEVSAYSWSNFANETLVAYQK